MTNFIATFIAAVIAVVIIGLALARIIAPTVWAAERFGFVGFVIALVLTLAFWITVGEPFQIL